MMYAMAVDVHRDWAVGTNYAFGGRVAVAE